MYTLLIPKQSSFKEKKSGGGSPFWKGFWEKKVIENPGDYKIQYEARQKKLSAVSASLNLLYKNNKNKKYYIEAKLDDMASSKSKEPNLIWKESGVQVVETRDDGIITISGTSEDINKFNTIIKNASFESASKTKKITKEDNLAREIFSVTSLFDKNTSVNKRISEDMKIIINSIDDKKSIGCILTVYYDQPESEYDNLYGILISMVGDNKIEKIDSKFFISNMSFRANLTRGDITKILENEKCNFISLIKPTALFSSARTTPNSDFNSLIVGAPLTEEIAVVIDSGIEQSIINNYVIQRENFLVSGQRYDKNHGTAVTSRLLFGDNFFSKIGKKEPLNPVGKIIDVQVLYKGNNGETNTDDKILQEAIAKSVKKYASRAIIYNLSITDRKQIDETQVSETTELIDDLSNKQDILFVCASGNQYDNFNLSYENIFNSNECCIAAPADAINALTVGAITGYSDSNSICPLEKFPSPFTRRGGMRNDIKKPELVAIGGNIKKEVNDLYTPSHMAISNNTYGVQMIDSTGFTHDVGSSFSTPLVTRDCLLLFDYLKKSNISLLMSKFNSNKANLIKALMIHSTTRIKQSVIINDSLKRAYGFGQINISGILQDDDNRISVVYTDKINYAEKKQKILIHFPPSLHGKEMEFIFTLVYNPPVNKNFKEYKMIDLKPSISFIRPEIENGQPTGKNIFKYIQPKHSWENYRSKYFNTIHFMQRKKINILDFQILIQMLVSNHLIDKYLGREEEEIFQNYALVLTIKDRTESGILRTEMLNTNQFHELIENTVQIQSTN